MNINKATFTFLLVFIGLSGYAQLNFDLIQGRFYLKGRVVDMQSKKPTPQANVRIINTGKGTTCDDQGYFSLVVSNKDTLKFTSTGYIAKTILVINIDSADYHTLQVELLQDFIKLREIVIYPFNGVDEFKHAFMEAKNTGKFILPGVPEPTVTGDVRPKLYNPISFLYDKIKKRHAADPNFKP